MKLATYAKDDKFIGRGLDVFGLKPILIAEVESRLSVNKQVSLLEIGCGKGNLLLNLAQLYPTLKLSGLNKNSSHGIKNKEELKERAEELGLTVSQQNLPYVYFADATKLPFTSSSFDLVVSQVTLLHVNNKARAVEEIYRVLKPKGVAIVSLGAYSIRRENGHPMPPFYKSLKRKLGTDFNPRFLVKLNNEFIPISKYIQSLRRDYDIELIKEPFISETQRGIAHWLVLKKKTDESLVLELRYKSKESQELSLLYAKNNPVNWGVIDVYNLVRK